MDDTSRENLASRIEAYWDNRSTTYSNGVRGELADNRAVVWQRVMMRLSRPVMDAARERGRYPRVLDLGCGPGFFTVLFAQAACRVNALDTSADMLERARENVALASPDAQVAFHHGDVAVLPFEDDTFDLVVCRNVTWLLREPERTYAEWLRVLRPGGKLLVFDANWYRYLVDPDIAAARQADLAGNAFDDWDEDSRATPAEEKLCEEIAAHLPLTPVLRPAWDLETLAKLGADARADEDVWREVWTEKEKACYASSPMFFVEAVK